jgi:protein-disulfide isomerase
MIEFSDFQCPFCGMFARTTELQLAKEFVDSGQLLLAFRHMPLEPIHALALGAAEGAVCAGRQGRFWEMHDELFADQRALAKDAVSAKAKSLGLDVSSFEACIETDGKTQVRSDETSAGSLGVHGTPAFFIGIIQPDRTVKVRKVLTGATDAKVFEDAINEVYTAVRLERR